MKIATLSDITLGFAAPQIEMLTASLARHFGADEAVLIEPDMKGRRALLERDGLAFRRIVTRMPPHHGAFHVEYNARIREFLDGYRPDVVVVTNGAVMPGLLLSGRRPRLLVYYMLESLEHQMLGGAYYREFNEMVRDWVDVIVVPERRRAAFDLIAPEWAAKPLVEVLNVAVRDAPPAREAPEREGPVRFLHAGTISPHTYCDALAGLKIDGARVDVAGPQDNDEARGLVRRGVESGALRDLGLLPTERLQAMLADYDYRFVLWRAGDFNSYFASPNKLFETIAAGVPAICTPNPLCADILRRYDCGILMDGWTDEALADAMRRACAIRRTERYAEFVANCHAAVRAELNWDSQFAKLAAVLPDLGRRAA